MKAGKLNNYVVIEGLKIKSNEFGEEESSIYTEKLKTRCDIQNDGGNRTNENGEIIYSYNKTFIFYDYMDNFIDEYDRIIYKSKPYRILSKDLVKETKTLYVRTELVNE